MNIWLLLRADLTCWDPSGGVTCLFFLCISLYVFMYKMWTTASPPWFFNWWFVVRLSHSPAGHLGKPWTGLVGHALDHTQGLREGCGGTWSAEVCQHSRLTGAAALRRGRCHTEDDLSDSCLVFRVVTRAGDKARGRRELAGQNG